MDASSASAKRGPEGRFARRTSTFDARSPPPTTGSPVVSAPETRAVVDARLRALNRMGRVRNFSLTPVNFSAEASSTPAEPMTALDTEAVHRVRAVLGNADALARVLEDDAHVFTLPLGADHHTLLHEAVLCKSPAALEAILHVPTVQVMCVDGVGATCLHWLCWFGDDRDAVEALEVLALLLAQPDVVVDCRDKRGYTPLMFAVDQGNVSFVRALVERGADVNARSASQTSPILIAVFHGSFAIAELLLQAGAELDVAGSDGLTPLMVATQMDNLDLVVFLVKSGATVEYATELKGTAKELAHSLVVKQFLIDSAFYQTHHDTKKQMAYQRIVEATRHSSTMQMHSLRASHDSLSREGSTLSSRSPMPLKSSSRKSPRPATPDSVSSSPPTVHLMPPPPGNALSNSSSNTLTSPQVKVYTSENHPLDLEYFEHPLLGSAKVGMCMCPGRNKPKKYHVWKRDLQTDLQAIASSGCDVVVTLVRSVELLSMGIIELFVRIKQLGMESLHFPVVDKWIPESMTSVMELISKLLAYVDQGKTIVIHCNGGKGRTGLVACAILVAKGLSVDDSIQAIRRRRKGMIRNPAQIMYLRIFEKSWRNEHQVESLSSSPSSSDVEDDPAPSLAEDPLKISLKAERKYHAGSKIVALTIHEAKDLPVRDGGNRELEPFVKVVSVSGPSIGYQWLRSPIVRNSTSPAWNFQTRFIVTSGSRWFCMLGVYDGRETDLLAVASITGAANAARDSLWLPCVSLEGTLAGSVRVSFRVEKG